MCPFVRNQTEVAAGCELLTGGRRPRRTSPSPGNTGADGTVLITGDTYSARIAGANWKPTRGCDPDKTRLIGSVSFHVVAAATVAGLTSRKTDGGAA